MSQNYNYLTRMSTVSDKVSNYVEDAIYLDEYIDEQSLVISGIDIIRDELKAIGISFTINVEDILDNPKYINGVIAIREYFDNIQYLEYVTGSKMLQLQLENVINSNDIQDDSIIHVLMDAHKHLGIGDTSKIEEIDYIIEDTVSTSLLKAHVNAVLLSVPISSDITDLQVVAHASIIPYIQIIVTEWSKIYNGLLYSVGLPQDTVSTYVDKYVQSWADPLQVEKYVWILNLDIENASQYEHDTHREILLQHFKSNRLNIAYHLHTGDVSSTQDSEFIAILTHEVILKRLADKKMDQRVAKLFLCEQDYDGDIRTSVYRGKVSLRYSNIMSKLDVIMNGRTDMVTSVRETCHQLIG